MEKKKQYHVKILMKGMNLNGNNQRFDISGDFIYRLKCYNHFKR